MLGLLCRRLVFATPDKSGNAAESENALYLEIGKKNILNSIFTEDCNYKVACAFLQVLH